MNSVSPIQSPCILICALEPVSGHCYGCGRNRDEISSWLEFTPQMRQNIMDELPQRVAKLERKPRRVTRRSKLRGDTRRRDVLDISS
jgi:predicted Fe-S protein YdhL (DUF1289 family)